MRFRVVTPRGQLAWDRAFSWGSYVAAFCQGIALGAFVQASCPRGVTTRNRISKATPRNTRASSIRISGM
jgi:cytochrome bd-type quinol oxidase subunit 2